MTKGHNSEPATVETSHERHLAPSPYQSFHKPTGCPGSVHNSGSSQVAAQCGQHQIDAHHHANTSLSGGSGKKTLTLHSLPGNGGALQTSPNGNRQQYVGASKNHAAAVNVRSATGPAPSHKDISQPGESGDHEAHGQSVQNGGKRKTAKRKTVKRHNRSLSKKRHSKTKRRSTTKRRRSSKKTKQTKKTQKRKGILNRRSKRKNKKINGKKVYFNI